MPDDETQTRLGHAQAVAVEKRGLDARCEQHPLVHELLDLRQDRRAALRIVLACLLQIRARSTRRPRRPRSEVPAELLNPVEVDRIPELQTESDPVLVDIGYRRPGPGALHEIVVASEDVDEAGNLIGRSESE